MGRVRLFWLLLLTWGCLFQRSAAEHGKKLPSAILVGVVYCDTCFQQGFSKTSHFISGASVAVECGDTGSGPTFTKEAKTDEHGEFSVELPLRVGKHIRSIKTCTVKLLSSSEPYCAVASTATSSSLHLKSSKKGVHIFSAGFFTFKPLKEPELCSEKPSPQTYSKFSSDQKTFLPYPVPNLPPVIPKAIVPPMPFIPQLPQFPNFPPLPNFSPIQKPPTETNPRAGVSTAQEEVNQPNTFFSPPSLFPNPFQPPPSLLPPNPFQPAPSLFPPNPFRPSPAPFFNVPPFAFFTPPPPPPVFPFPFPPFPPFRPVFPGIPPASIRKENSP